jgi:hypothetical protein
VGRDEEQFRSCDNCGQAGTRGPEADLIPDRDLEGHWLCVSCIEALERQQQFVDWGFGEAPDDLG